MLKPDEHHPCCETTKLAQGFKILIIEDSPEDFANIESHLKNSGYVGEINRSASFPTMAAAFLGVSLVVLDLGLPGLKGAEAAHLLRKMAPNTPAIVCGGTNKDTLEEVRKLGYAVSDKATLPASLPRAIDVCVCEAVKESNKNLESRVMEKLQTKIAASGGKDTWRLRIKECAREELERLERKKA